MRGEEGLGEKIRSVVKYYREPQGRDGELDTGTRPPCLKGLHKSSINANQKGISNEQGQPKIVCVVWCVLQAATRS